MDDEPNTKYCHNCGQELRSGAQFCKRCGVEQELEQTGPEVRTATVPTSETVQQDDTVSGSESEDTKGSGISRRQMIAGGVIGVVVAFAGASFYLGLTASSHERVDQEAAWSNRETEQTDTGEIIRGRISLSEGEYFAQGFSTYGTPELGWAVQNVSGGSLDVWVFPESSFNDYEDSEDSIEYDTRLSETGITTATERVGGISGDEDWYVIFDNSSVYGTEPDGGVEFETAMEIG
jgi:hypothetical protein